MEPNRAIALRKPYRETLARLAVNKWVAIAVVVFMPGGVFLPIVYAAIRLSRSR